jgi:hypothetical protein
MRTPRFLGATSLVATAALVAGCAPSIRSERDANIPVPHGATWAFGGPASSAPSGDTLRDGRYIPQRYAYGAADPIVRQRFRRAIEATMREKGFRFVADTSQADFLLEYSLGGGRVYRGRRASATTGVSFGWYPGWGYPSWGFYRPWGVARPWGGWYAPWGWGWGFGFYGWPAYGYAASAYPAGARYYREGELVVQLALRSDREVAWIGRYRVGERELSRMTDAEMRKAVGKLFASLK